MRLLGILMIFVVALGGLGLLGGCCGSPCEVPASCGIDPCRWWDPCAHDCAPIGDPCDCCDPAG